MTDSKRPYYHKKLALQGKVPKKYKKYTLEVKIRIFRKGFSF